MIGIKNNKNKKKSNKRAQLNPHPCLLSCIYLAVIHLLRLISFFEFLEAEDVVHHLLLGCEPVAFLNARLCISNSPSPDFDPVFLNRNADFNSPDSELSTQPSICTTSVFYFGFGTEVVPVQGSPGKRSERASVPGLCAFQGCHRCKGWWAGHSNSDSPIRKEKSQYAGMRKQSSE